MTSLGPDCPFLGEAGVAMGRVMTPGDQALCGGTRGDTRHQGAATCRRLHADQAEPGVRKGVPETCCGEAENPGQVGCWLCACVCVLCVCVWLCHLIPGEGSQIRHHSQDTRQTVPSPLGALSCPFMTTPTSSTGSPPQLQTPGAISCSLFLKYCLFRNNTKA